MPITQDRLLTLLQAAENVLQNYQTLQGTIEMEARAASAGTIPPEEALRNIALSAVAMPFRNALVVINGERIRYGLTHAKNSYIREYRAGKRRGEGTRSVEAQPKWREPDRLQAESPEYARVSAAAQAIDAEEGLVPDGRASASASSGLSPEAQQRLLAESARIIAEEVRKAEYELTHGTPAQQASARAFLLTQRLPAAPEPIPDGTLDSLDLLGEAGEAP